MRFPVLISRVDVGSPESSLIYGYQNVPRQWDIVTQAVCLVVGTFCVWMRIYTKFWITRAPGWEDCMWAQTLG